MIGQFFFRKLSSIGLEINEETKEKNFEIIKESCYENTSPDFEREISGWINNYIYQIKTEQISLIDRTTIMDTTNPLYVPRNYILQLAIEKAQEEDFSVISEIMQIMKDPYRDQGPALRNSKRDDQLGQRINRDAPVFHVAPKKNGNRETKL